jgi:hypothetical protein
LSRLLLTFFMILICVSAIRCTKDRDANGPDPSDSIYFPPLSGTAWESQLAASLGWNESAVQPLLNFFQEKNTRSFMILGNGWTSAALDLERLITPLHLITMTSGLNDASEMYAAMGANDQRIYIVPSRKMAVIRMGRCVRSRQPKFRRFRVRQCTVGEDHRGDEIIVHFSLS